MAANLSILKNRSDYEKKLFIEARNCWQKYENYNLMMSCLEKKGFSDAKYILKDLTLEEKGFILGVTRERVRQIYDQAIKKLRKYILTDQNLKEYINIK